MTKKIIWTDKCNTPGGHYSQGVVHNDILYTSGIVPVVPKTHEVVDSSIEDATIRTLENLKAVAEAAGTSLDHTLKVTVFLTDMSLFSRFNKIYSEYFNINPPARSTVGVESLLRTMIEIEAIIEIPLIDR